MIDFGFGVSLLPLDSSDMATIRAWRNHPGVWRWCRQHDMISDYDQERWFKRQAEDPSIKMYKIGTSQGPVGVCGLTSIDPVNRRAEFSIYIAPEHQRKGLARRALNTLMAHGFRNLGLHNIWGESFDGNPAQDLFRELGFKEEGRRRNFYFRDGRFIDASLFSILEHEWKLQA